MRRINASSAALAVALLSLFVALGGTALAVSQVGTKQIKNSAVTSAKLHNGAVTNSKLANNAVGSGKLKGGAVTNGKLANGAVTVSKVASNTFLPAAGTAVNSNQLGGQPPSAYVGGGGAMRFGQLTLASGPGSDTLLITSFGLITASCNSGHLGFQFLSGQDGVSLVRVGTDSAGTTAARGSQLNDSGTVNVSLGAGITADAITWQGSYVAGGVKHTLTAVTTGQVVASSCVYSGQVAFS
jgi:hypothetical protein